jgi:hypothetical protein
VTAVLTQRVPCGSCRRADATLTPTSSGYNQASIGAHVGPDLAVLLFVLDGTGQITTELNTIDLHPGALVWLPERSRRQFTAGPQKLSYLTVHQRRQSLILNAAPPPEQ